MDHNINPVRVLLLAPQKTIGGIATWAQILTKYNNPQKIAWRVIDTSRHYVELGQRLGVWGAVMGLRDAILRFFSVLASLIIFRPHIIYITTSPSIGMLVRDIPLIMLLKCLGKRVVLHLHGGNIIGFFGTGGLRRRITCWGLNCCHAVFVITRDIEKVARQWLNPQKVYYVPNMISDQMVDEIDTASRKQPKPDRPAMLIHVAWQAPEKGSLDIVEAMQYVKKPIQCELIGMTAPENAQRIDQRIMELGVTDIIRRVGLKKGLELKNLYQSADIFLFPSYFEGFPMVILEAMAYGLPIIASDVGNIREIIGFNTDTSAGSLLKQKGPADPKEIADKIDSLIDDLPLRQQMSSNGCKRIKEKYLASKVVPNIEVLLMQLATIRLTPQSINAIFEQKYL